MSWGYWGIVAGLGVLLAVFFISLDLFYSDTKEAAKRNGPGAEERQGGSRTAASNAKHAA